MKYLIIRDGENIKHVERIGHDFTAEDVVVVDEDKMPVYFHQDGKAAKLKYSDAEGVHYEYADIPVSDEVTGDELMDMIEEVL